MSIEALGNGLSMALCIQGRHSHQTMDVTSLGRMRTTLDIDADVLELARGLADARHTSVGKALSALARTGAAARIPTSMKNGFCVFEPIEGTPQFGPKDVRAALDEEDSQTAGWFIEKRRG
jgi:hypothetical protein